MAEPDMDQMMGPVLPKALNTKATISTPPVKPGEKLKLSEKEMLILPKSTPKTIPMAMGKKSVSERRFSSFPSCLARADRLSFCPTTVSLSPNFKSNSGAGERSIPLRRRRVTVQLKCA